MVARQGPVVVVSNRLPVTAKRTPSGIDAVPSSGGLVAALDPVLRAEGGTWFGWPGIDLGPQERFEVPNLPYRLSPIVLSVEEIDDYYHGFSNRTLWPLFHSLVERSTFDVRTWDAYEAVNARFASAVGDSLAGAGLVWVHDYHLMRLPRFLRRTGYAGRIAFFLHIPFPSYDIFRLLPWDREILRGILAADLVGFHVESYARNFMDCAERLLGARVDRQAWTIENGDRSVRIGAFPLGIDASRFEGRARSVPAASDRRQRQRVVLGVDRLDYTKGIPERLRAFENLLERHPEHREKVILLQLAVPSRADVEEYRDLKREIDETVGRVNGRFGTATWTPIHYLYRSVPMDDLAALYRDAEVALVTPLRDGMNLVAKEYVACQVSDPGVLVLSRLAGAAETMHEAVLVNPYNREGTADAIHRALTMDESERRSRMTALRSREARNDVFAWLQRFLEAASASPAPLRLPSDADFEAWFGTLIGEYRIALCLDFEGTLVPRRDARPSVPSRRIRAALEALAACDQVDLAILSYRSVSDLRDAIGLEGVVYAGSGGLEIEGGDLPPFRHEDLEHFQEKTAELAAALRALEAPGMRIEEKGSTLAVHFRDVPLETRHGLLDRVLATVEEAGFQSRAREFSVEIAPPIAWDKGNAVFHVLRGLHGPDWAASCRVVYAGDDDTDEAAFRVLSGLGLTFRIGSADATTSAARRLPSIEALASLLDWLVHREDLVGAVEI